VASVLELPRIEGASPAMIRQAVLQSHESLRDVNLTAHFDQRRRQMALIVAALTLLVSMLLLVVRPSITDLWLRRTFLASSEPWPQNTYLSVLGMDNNAMIVPRGEPFVLRVGARQGSVSPEVVNVRFRDGSGERVSASLTRFAANDFRYDFPAVTNDTEIEIRGGDDELPLMIHPVDRPRMRRQPRTIFQGKMPIWRSCPGPRWSWILRPTPTLRKRISRARPRSHRPAM
jgi:hypothetical protein